VIELRKKNNSVQDIHIALRHEGNHIHRKGTRRGINEMAVSLISGQFCYWNELFTNGRRNGPARVN